MHTEQPFNPPRSVTQPCRIQTVTYHAKNAVPSIHLEDELNVVYRSKEASPKSQQTIALLAGMAYASGTKVSITYAGGIPGEEYDVRFMIRLNLEGERGMVPWGDREKEKPKPKRKPRTR